MFRVTTPLHRFRFPQDPSTYSKILITYWQTGKIILEKTDEDMTFESEETEEGTKYYGFYNLNQNETKLFKANSDIKLQARVLTENGDAYASHIINLKVSEVLNDDILEV